MGTTRSGAAAGMIALNMESSVGNRGQQKTPLVLSAPEISETEVDLIEEAVKDFKRVSTVLGRTNGTYFTPFFCTSLYVCANSQNMQFWPSLNVFHLVQGSAKR